jgi:N-methylhydantoinase A
MLLADERHDFIRTFYGDLAGIDFAALVQTHSEMVREALAGLRHKDSAEQQIHLDLRYVGQEFTLQVPVTLDQLKAADRHGIRRAFDALYEHRYAHHSPDEPVEMVNIRLAVIGKRPRLRFPSVAQGKTAAPAGRRNVYLTDPAKPVACPVYERPALGAGTAIAGPALIQEHGTTTVLFERDQCEVAPSGELVISVGGAA